ncbi:uncharacterized protein LOC118648906 [Monomorium pharaonis]|uniref:uncharacterized protein LOC118645073 n=1 Tax=Monomorium pharaonis TaxID=307658 RepID=UPI00174614B0|nr:uncharacterized protein LOC118645073 [Monomorium pharaonis]XP_036141338.1 uncharacterized protein LOC118645073 [Monomorium pharaonis]XP_036141341.1 uncharacterized protein LOC118645073 [Monomorium pharaonis]XP_036141343.1 uncharacterized protein LOC118645073 [Monomorium pharaonis]XP_036141348.1 uncharacterized protein LOC118645073 [Monomorium pharaonis]XP_036141390.1 uncharacterized protein LOC118645101 [Monomorium pharaonis]XP_036141391.1 uncharacterized protein LOC118645101 [Monomorium p
MYTVVEFEDGIMAVPSAWVDTKELTCKWPPYSDVAIEKAIIDIDEVTEDWDTLSIIRVFGKSVRNLETAKEKARLAEMVSDCDNEEVLKKSRHERKRKAVDSTNEDSDENSQDPKKISKNKSLYKSKIPSTLLSLNARQNVSNKKLLTTINDGETYKQSKDCTKENKKEIPSTLKTSILPRNSFSYCDINSVNDDFGDTNNDIPTPRQSDVVKTFEKSVRVTNTHDITTKIPNNDINEKLNYLIGLEEENVKKNNAILQEMKEIRKVMINLRPKTYNDPTVQSVEESVIKETNLNDFFPLNDNNALEALEEKLENRVFQKDVMRLLTKRGGRSAYELATNILAKVFTNSFAAQYSYYGKQKKKPLSELKITKCIIEAVSHSYQDIKEHDVEKKIGNWLANAPTRVLRERIKKEVEANKNKENVNQDEEELDSP